MPGNLDERVEAIIDELCISVPAYLKPKMILLRDIGVFWRIYLYLERPLRSVDKMMERYRQQKMISEKRTEADKKRTEVEEIEKGKVWGTKDDRDKLIGQALELEAEAERMRTAEERRTRLEDKAARREADRRSQEMASVFFAGLDRLKERFLRFGAVQERVQLSAMLLFALLAMLGALSTGGGCAALAAMFMFFWLSVCLTGEYRPVSRGIRQRYLGAMLLRTAGFLVLLAWLFGGYIRGGVGLNIVLQSAMIVMLALHLLLFVTCIAMNRRQQLMARALCGVLGIVPALAAAAAAALLAVHMTRSPVGAGLCAAGTVLLFLSDELDMTMMYGSLRLRFGRSWTGLLLLLSSALLLCGAWIIG